MRTTGRDDVDEWYIPYRATSYTADPRTSIPFPPQGGIGQSPVAVKPRHSFMSVFSSGLRDDRKQDGKLDHDFRFPRANPSGTRLPRSSSFDAPPNPSRIPSSTSVPTGLAAPKMLFSPLNRELRHHHTTSLPMRQRTVSAPRDPLEYHLESRWQASTMCDRYVYPRPALIPHLITPPQSPLKLIDSPEQDRIKREGYQREKEREEWAEVVRKRGRSLSLSATLPPGAPIIGNAKARTQQKSVDESRPRKNSFRHRLQSVSSFGAKSEPRLGESHSSKHYTETKSRSHDPDVDDPFHAKRRSDLQFRRNQHQQTRSDPDSTDLRARKQSRSLHFRQPSLADTGGVVVIGPQSSRRVSSTVRQGDTSKPLPRLPNDDLPVLVPLIPLSSEIGVAISPDSRASSKSSQRSPLKSTSQTSPISPTSHARAILEKQHQRALTKRAFQSPTGRPKSAQHNLSSSSSTVPRRKTAMEEAIGRSRAGSIGSYDLRSHEDTPSKPVMAPPLSYPVINEIIPSPSFSEHRIVRKAVPAEEGLLKRPELVTNDTATSAISGVSVYTDATEGWNRSREMLSQMVDSSFDNTSDTSSPKQSMDDKDFKGLFFRTPQDRGSSFTPSVSRSPLSESFPTPGNTSPIGLGYGLESVPPLRSSGTSDTTTEIDTPIFQSGAGSPGTSPALVFNSFSAMRLDGTPKSGYSGGSSPETVQANSEDYRVSHVSTGRGVPVATPKTDDNPGTLNRRSHIPEFHLGSTPEFIVPRSPTFGPSLPIPSPGSPGVSPGQTGSTQRNSAFSLIHKFPSPPLPSAATMSESSAHASAFGQLVTGPPGAGKTTYCHGMHQFLTALGRPVHIINLDPAVPNPPYPCSISITDLITLEEVMEEYGLGPNGAMLYCIEYLEKNFDWLVEKLDELLLGEGDGYVIFDTPGQVELWTNHDSLKRMVERLTKMDYRLAAVHLSDAHYITEGSKFISVVLLALRAMLQLEMPHVNVLSKMDLLSTYGELPFNLDYYTEVQDLSYLLHTLDSEPRAAKFGKLNKAMCELVEEFGLVGFETLAVECLSQDKTSMMKLLRLLDKVTGYIFIPSQPSDSTDTPETFDTNPHIHPTKTPNTHSLFSSASGAIPSTYNDITDVQERWLDRKEAFDDFEREGWKKEGELRARMIVDEENQRLRREKELEGEAGGK